MSIFVFDESSIPHFCNEKKSQNDHWVPFIVAGATLPKANRDSWVDYCQHLSKGRDIRDEAKILEIIGKMKELGVQSVYTLLDFRNTSPEEVERMKQEFASCYWSTSNCPERLKRYCAQIDPKLRPLVLNWQDDRNVSNQDFGKLVAFLETIENLLRRHIHNRNSLEEVHCLIDDQNESVVSFLRGFIYVYLCHRSHQVPFLRNGEKSSSRFTRKENDKSYLDITKMLNIQVDAGSKADDHYKELYIADYLANFIRRTIAGKLSPKIAQQLRELVYPCNIIHFKETEFFDLEVPNQAREQCIILGLFDFV